MAGNRNKNKQNKGSMYHTGSDRGQAETRQEKSKSIGDKMENKVATTTPAVSRPRENVTTGTNDNKGEDCCPKKKSTTPTTPSSSSNENTFSSASNTVLDPSVPAPINTTLSNESPGINDASTGNNSTQAGMSPTYTTGVPTIDKIVEEIKKTTIIETSSSHSYMSYGKNNVGEYAGYANMLGNFLNKYNVPFSNILQNVGSGPFTNTGLNSAFNNMLSLGAMGGSSVGGLAHANVAVFQTSVGNVHLNVFGSTGRATKHTNITNSRLEQTEEYTLTGYNNGLGTGKNSGNFAPVMSNYSASSDFSSSTTHNSQHNNNWMAGLSLNTDNESGLNVGIAAGTGQVHTTDGALSNNLVALAAAYNFNRNNLGSMTQEALGKAWNKVLDVLPGGN